MITWLGQPAKMRWLGQEQPDPAEAAGQAAKEEALKAEWPPTRANAAGVGAAAGAAGATAGCAAAGVATGGVTAVAAGLGICGAIGKEIGEFLGGAIYDIIDGLFGGEEYVAPQFDLVIALRLRKSVNRLVALVGGAPGRCLYPTEGQFRAVRDGGICASEAQLRELDALYRWGLPSDPAPYYNRDGLTNYLHLLAAAESARASEIIAQRQLQAIEIEAQGWRALASVSEFCANNTDCINRKLRDIEAACRQQGNVPGTLAYANCAVFLAAALPRPTAPTTSPSSPVVPIVVGAAVIGGLAWLLLV